MKPILQGIFFASLMLTLAIDTERSELRSIVLAWAITTVIGFIAYLFPKGKKDV